MNKRHFSALWFCLFLFPFLLTNAAHGATYTLKVVGVNGRGVPGLSRVTVAPGDAIEIDVYLSGWGDPVRLCKDQYDTPPCQTRADCWFGQCVDYQDLALRTCQFTAGGLLSGESGALLPLYWEGPRVGWACTTDAECGIGGICRTDGTCGFIECRSSCPPGLVCQDGPYFCVGSGHDPESGAFINEQRPDYAFAGLDTISAVRVVEPEIAAGTTLWDSNNAVPDSGQAVYVGTFTLVPTIAGDPAGKASGTFVVGLSDDPLWTFVIAYDAYGLQATVAPDVEPVTIDVRPMGPARFGYLDTPQGGAASAEPYALRVTLRKMYNTTADDPDGAITCPAGRLGPSLAQFEGQTRWFGPPMQFEDDAVEPVPDYLASPLVCTPEEAELRDWSAAALAATFGSDVRTGRVYFFGPEVVPCSIYEIARCTDPLDESTCEQQPATVFTVAVGDAVTPFGRPADPNFIDVAAIVAKYKAQALPHETQALFRGNIVGDLIQHPEKQVSFMDISAAVDGYKRIPYQEQGPCNAATGIDNCGSPCATGP